MIKTARLFAFGAVAGAAALMAAAPAAKAQTTDTFAQYFQVGTPDPNNPGQTVFAKTFVLTNNGATSTITSSATPVLFNYSGGTVFATLNFSTSGTATQATNSTTGGQNRLSQTFSDYSFSITSGSTNYLSGSGKNLVLSGTVGGGSPTLNVSAPPGDNVVFTSSVIDVASATAKNFAISFSGADPTLGVGSNGYINSFNASSTGTFAKNSPAAVPEPGMMTFALTSGAGLAGMVLRGRRKSKKAA